MTDSLTLQHKLAALPPEGWEAIANYFLIEAGAVRPPFAFNLVTAAFAGNEILPKLAHMRSEEESLLTEIAEYFHQKNRQNRQNLEKQHPLEQLWAEVTDMRFGL